MMVADRIARFLGVALGRDRPVAQNFPPGWVLTVSKWGSGPVWANPRSHQTSSRARLA